MNSAEKKTNKALAKRITLRMSQGMHNPIPFPDNVAYQFSICSKCGERWQNIDYGCARHASKCGYPLPPKADERTSDPNPQPTSIQHQKESA